MGIGDMGTGNGIGMEDGIGDMGTGDWDWGLEIRGGFGTEFEDGFGIWGVGTGMELGMGLGTGIGN